MISLVRDGVYFSCPDSRCISEDFKSIRREITEVCGVDVSIKDISGEKVCMENTSITTGWLSIGHSPLGRDGRLIRNPWEGVRNICIPLAIYNVSGAADAPTSMREGPMTYREACSLLHVSLEAIQSPPALVQDGEYILHHQDHCAGIRIDKGIAQFYDSRRCGSRIFNASELIDLIFNMESFVLFRLRSGVSTAGLASASMYLRDSAVDSIARPEAPVWKMDKYQPIRLDGNAEAAFMGRLRSELAYLESDLAWRRQRTVSANRVKCPLCRFRIFDRKSRALDRIRPQHSEKAGFSPTGAVYRIAQDIHNGDLARSVLADDPLRCDVMQRAASLTQSWIGELPREIARQIERTSDITRYISVLFSGDEGPKYPHKANATWRISFK